QIRYNSSSAGHSASGGRPLLLGSIHTTSPAGRFGSYPSGSRAYNRSSSSTRSARSSDFPPFMNRAPIVSRSRKYRPGTYGLATSNTTPIGSATASVSKPPRYAGHDASSAANAGPFNSARAGRSTPLSTATNTGPPSSFPTPPPGFLNTSSRFDFEPADRCTTHTRSPPAASPTNGCAGTHARSSCNPFPVRSASTPLSARVIALSSDPPRPSNSGSASPTVTTARSAR